MNSSIVDSTGGLGMDFSDLPVNPNDSAASFATSICNNILNDSFWNSSSLESDFTVIFSGLINLYLTGTSAQKELSIHALLVCFKRLVKPFVRRECLRLVTLGCWKGMSEIRRNYEFKKNSNLLRLWEQVKDIPENGFFSRLIDDCIEFGDANIAELINYCLLQWPTRRYLLALLDDKCFIPRCFMKKHKFTQHLVLSIKGTSTYDPSSEQTLWTHDDYIEDVHEKIERFQLFVRNIEGNNALVTESFSSFCNAQKCLELCDALLSDELKQALITEYAWPSTFLLERICDSFTLYPAQETFLINEPLPNFNALQSLDLEKDRLLPLTSQFLNQTDYLIRLYKLLKYEFMRDLSEVLQNSLKQSKPSLDKKFGIVLDGWSRYSAPCHHMDDCIYQILLSPRTSDLVVGEWKKVKTNDFVYLCKVVKSNDQYVFEIAEPAKVLGVVRPVPKESSPADSGLSREHHAIKVMLSLDLRLKDVNYILRLDPKDNSLVFLSILKSLLSKPKVQPLIDPSIFYFGYKQSDARSFNDINEWYNESSTNVLIVSGPTSSGKTSMMLDFMKLVQDKKVFIMVPTAESADFLAERLVAQMETADVSTFVRLGFSPRSLNYGKVGWYLEYRQRLLRQVEDFLDMVDPAHHFSSSCEAAIFNLEHLQQTNETAEYYLSKLRRILPLEFIQNDDHREDYLMKYFAQVTLMTYGFAAINRNLLLDCSPDIIIMEDSHLTPELLSSIALFSNHHKHDIKVILLGNPDIGPVTEELLLSEYGYGHSLFRRLLLLDASSKIELCTSFNVPQQCVHFFSNFNVGRCIVECFQVENDSSDVATETQNIAEAEELVEYYLSLEVSGISGTTAILAPYNAQLDLILDVFKAKDHTRIPPLYTMDKFTGAQADIVLCSMTLRSISVFLRKRLQSLFTRAIHKLVLFHSPSFNPLILYDQDK